MDTDMDSIVIQKTKSNIDALSNAVFLNCDAHGLDVFHKAQTDARSKQKHRKVKFDSKLRTSDDKDDQPFVSDGSPIISNPYAGLYIQIRDKYYQIKNDTTLLHNTILMNSVQRRENNKSDIDISNIVSQVMTAEDMDVLHKPVTFITLRIIKLFIVKDRFYTAPAIDLADFTDQIRSFLGSVTYIGNDQSYLVPLTIGCDEIHCQIQTYSTSRNRYRICMDPDTESDDDTSSQDSRVSQDDQDSQDNLDSQDADLFKMDICNMTDLIIRNRYANQTDMSADPVYGMVNQIEMLKRICISRSTSTAYIVKNLRVPHTKYIMLHGPAGCGKKTLAKYISRSVLRAEPVVVLNQNCGSCKSSESSDSYDACESCTNKIADIFEPVIDDHNEFGDESKLHIIIFDDIHKRRTMSTELTRLMTGPLSKMNNFILFGITDRISEASHLIRPSYFEHVIEVGLPNAQDRLAILITHIDKFERHSCTDSIDPLQIAECTEGLTGADMSNIINIAVTYALYRETRDLDDDDEHEHEHEHEYEHEHEHADVQRFNMTQDDLISAVRDVTDRSNLLKQIEQSTDYEIVEIEADDELDELDDLADAEPDESDETNESDEPDAEDVHTVPAEPAKPAEPTVPAAIQPRMPKQSPYGVYLFDKTVYDAYHRVASSIKTGFNNLIGISGVRGSGKTSMAFNLAKIVCTDQDIRYVDRVSYIGLTRYETCLKLRSEFDNTQKIIILDDIDTMLISDKEYVTHNLLVLLNNLEHNRIAIVTGSAEAVSFVSFVSSVFGSNDAINLTGLPVFTKESNADLIKSAGYLNYDEYASIIDEIQAIVCKHSNVSVQKIGLFELFGCGDSSRSIVLRDLDAIKRIPIKDYISLYERALRQKPEYVQIKTQSTTMATAKPDELDEPDDHDVFESCDDLDAMNR